MKTVFLIFLSTLSLWLSACATNSHKPDLQKYTNTDCRDLYESSFRKDVLQSLQIVSRLYENACYHEVIGLGEFVRTHSRDKVYNMMAETAEFVLPDGSLTEYILESYERSYLSFLMAASYQKLKLHEDSDVELRQAYDEGKALIYNYGDDPVNLALQAALWENSNQNLNSRPLWKKIWETAGADSTLKGFAETRIREIDQGFHNSKKWKIYAYSQLPQIDWKMNLNKSSGSYFDLTPKTTFASTCSSDNGLLLPTEAWMKKISIRHSHDYHPLLNVRSWTRLPIGVTLGITTAVVGVGLGVGGCGLAVAMVSGHDSGSGRAATELCGYSISAGTAIAGQSGNVTNYVLEPDLRRWEQVPAAFLISREEKPEQEESCRPMNYGESSPNLIRLD